MGASASSLSRIGFPGCGGIAWTSGFESKWASPTFRGAELVAGDGVPGAVTRAWVVWNASLQPRATWAISAPYCIQTFFRGRPDAARRWF